MSRLVVPLRGKTLWSTGDLLLWAKLDLLFKDRTGAWIPETIRIDTATEVTTFPAYRATLLGLPMPQQPSRGASHTQSGLEIRSGLLRLRVAGMDATEYVTACFFLGNPNSPPTGKAATLPRKLLQPLALLDQLQFHFKKNATVTSPYGEMIIQKK